MVEAAPDSVDLQDVQFKLHSKLKIFDSTDYSKFKNASNLVVAASKYGLVFAGSVNATLEVIQLKSIESSQLGKAESRDFAKRCVQLHSAASHLSLNCEQSLLAVVITKNECATAVIYSVPSFLAQNVVGLREIRISATPGVTALESCWNPALGTVYSVCKSDGSLGIYTLQEKSADINELPAAAAARCFCWSPKGKQIVVGSVNGALTQYKPDLKAVKAIPQPALQGTGPFSVVTVFWLTNYQFVAVYKNEGNPEARPSILVVNAPKGAPVSFVNYEDICYSNGMLRPHQYYFAHQSAWGMLLVASANSMEVGVLGISQMSDPAIWQQWNQIDAARAELPLSQTHQETFPVGFTFDTGVTLQLSWGENQTLPPMPMVHILSHHGVLCSFTLINIRQGAPLICQPPEMLPDQSGLCHFVAEQQTTSIPQNTTVKPEAVPSAAPQNLASAAKPASQLFGVTPNFGALQLPGGTTSAASLAFKLQTTVSSSPSSGATGMTTSVSGAAPGLLPSISSAPGATVASVPSSAPAFGSNLAFGGVSKPTTVTSFVGSLQPPLLEKPAQTPAGNLPAVAAGSQAPALVGSPPSLFSGKTATSSSGGPLQFLPGKAAQISVPVAPQTASGQISSAQAPIGNASPLFSGTQSLAPAGSAPPQLQFLAPKPTQTPMAPHFTPAKPTAGVSSSPQTSAGLFSGKAQVTEIQGSKPLLATPKDHQITEPKKDDSVLNDEMLQASIREEVKNFKSQLQELLQRCRTISLDVGTEEEKSHLVLTTDSLLDFYKELQDTTDSQVAEVHYLKQALVQSFAWFEDANSRHKRYTDPGFVRLLQAQELDPVSEKQLADIKHLIYYIEAQLKQVDGFLDNKWADFQDSCKKAIKGKLHIPTLEPIYQSLIRQNAILEKQRYILKDIGARIKSRNKKAASFPQVMNVNKKGEEKDKTGYKFADDIENEMRRLKIAHEDVFEARYNKIVATEKKFTEFKQKKLCAFFTNRNVVHVAPKKPKFVPTPSKFALMGPYTSSLAAKSPGLENISAEANLSASNLFSFSLLDKKLDRKGAQPRTISVDEKDELVKTGPFKVLEGQPQKPIVVGGTGGRAVFSFTASSALSTASMGETRALFGTSTSFSLGSVTITPVSTLEKDKSNFSFSFDPAPKPDLKSGDSKPAESAFGKTAPAAVKPFLGQQVQDVVLIKPNALKNAIDHPPFGNLAQVPPFSFMGPKTNQAFQGTPRESLEPGYNFGTALSLEQQSTPKPKPRNGAGPEAAPNSNLANSAITTTTATAVVTESASSPSQFGFPKIVATSSLQISAGSSATTTLGSLLAGGATTSGSIFGGFGVSASAPVSTSAPAAFQASAASSSATIFSSPSVSLNPSTTVGTAFAPSATSTTTSTSAAGTGAGSTTLLTSSLSGPTPSSSAGLPFLGATSSSPALAPMQGVSAFTSSVSAPVASSSHIEAGLTPTTSGGITSSIFGSTTSGSIFGAKTQLPFSPKSTVTPVTTTATLVAQLPTTAAGLPASTIQPIASTTAVVTTSTSFSFVQSAGVEVVTSVTPVEGAKTGSIFGGGSAGISTTSHFAPSPTPSSIFSGQPAVPKPHTDDPTVTLVASAAPTLSASSFSFLQGAATTNTTPKPTPDSKPTFGVGTTGDKPLAQNTAAAATTTFSFLQPGASTPTSSAAQKPPDSTFGETVSVPQEAPATTFNFVQPAVSSAAPKMSSAFGGETKTADTVFGAKPQEAGGSFGFDSLAVGSEGANKFSFGNLTVSALSPQAKATSVATPTATATTFSFAIPASTAPATTSAGFGAAYPNPFLKPTTTSVSSFLGQPICSPSSFPPQNTGSVFGQTSGNIFAQKPSTPNTSGGSIFGGSGPVFGAQATTSIFGGAATTSAPTPSGGTFSSFGAQPTSSGGNFSFTQTGTSQGFSGNIFGAKPAFAQPAAFGQQAAFGAPPAFGSPQSGGSIFGGGSFSGNSFGSPPSFGQQKPTFGSPPGFGQQAAFGSSPAFGESPTFGSPQKVFGSTAAPTGASFGTTMQENSTFANLANQTTLGFGSLAQNQSAPPNQPPQFTGGAQFTSWR